MCAKNCPSPSMKCIDSRKVKYASILRGVDYVSKARRVEKTDLKKKVAKTTKYDRFPSQLCIGILVYYDLRGL